MSMLSVATTVTYPPAPDQSAAADLGAPGEREPPHLHLEAAGVALATRISTRAEHSIIHG